MRLMTQLYFGCDMSKAGPLVTENDFTKDFLSFLPLIVVKEPVAINSVDQESPGHAAFTLHTRILT
jgi:hypothetical protein